MDLYDDRIVRVNFCAVAAATPAGEPPIADASLYAEVLNNLALVCEAQRKHREALALLLLSESVTEVAHGPRDPRSWQVLINIGCIQSELGEAEQAIQAFERAIAAAEKGLGPNHRLVGEALAREATLLRKLKRKREAASLAARARAIMRENAADDFRWQTVDLREVQELSRKSPQ